MAFEWLKPILGDNFTDELAELIEQEGGKHVIPRGEFNKQKKAADDLKKLLDERDITIKSLQEGAGDLGAKQKELDDMKAAHEQEILNMKIQFIEMNALKEAGAKNPRIAMSLLDAFNKKNPKLSDDESTVEGLDDFIKGLQEAADTSYEFDIKEPAQTHINGARPAGPGNQKGPTETSDYSTRLAAARESGDMAAVSHIKREAAKEGIILI